MYVVVIIIHQNVDVASWLYNGVSHAVLYQGGSTDIKRPDALRIAPAFYVKDMVYQPCTAATPGRILPSMALRRAPPPVDT